MPRSKPPKKTSSADCDSTLKKKSTKLQESSSSQEIIERWHKEITALSYEESLAGLDLLLENLQNDNVPVEDLQENYLRGKLYLEHCESLLRVVEQEVIELNPEDLD